MIVVDASAVLACLLRLPPERAVERLLNPAETLHAPELVDVEVAQVVRRYWRAGAVDAARGREALDDLRALPLERYGHGPLLARVWELRHNVTAYDAAYLALAEALDAPLVTCDARLARVPGHAAAVEVLSREA